MATRAITYIDEVSGLPTTIEVEDQDLFGFGTATQRPVSGDSTGDLWLLDDEAGRYLLQRWNGSSWQTLFVSISPGGSTDNAIVKYDGGNGQIQPTGIIVSDLNEVRHVGTVELDKGADIASAGTLSLGTDGNYFDVTGSVNITAVSSKPIGTRVLLRFNATVLISHSSAIDLMDGKDFKARAGDHLELVSYDGSNWREFSRHVVHRTLATLVHGVGQSNYREVVRTSGRVTAVITWDSAGMNFKLRETNITRTSGLVSQVVRKQYDGTSDEVLVETFTDVVARTSNQVSSVTETFA